MSYRVAVALGSNLGDRLETLRAAVVELRKLGRVEGVSSLYETAPVGGPDQPPYLNAAVVLTTALEPARLLERLLAVEERMGRERKERWGPRSLDLDLITAVDVDGQPVPVETDRLVLPHPRAHLRRFVLAPLCDVWPTAPVAGAQPAAGFLPTVGDQEVDRLGRDWTERRRGTARAYLAGQALLFGAYALALRRKGPIPSSLAVVGGAASVAGVFLAGWGVVALDRAASPYPEPRPGTVLVAHGPYRLIRHPIYLGLVAALGGVALLRRSAPALGIAMVLGGYLSAKARYEETRLRLTVPGYAAYQRRVRARMLPVTNAPT